MNKALRLLCLFLVVLLIVANVVGCGSSSAPAQQTAKTEEKAGGKAGANVAQKQPEANKKYVNTAKEVELFAGEFVVGEDVVPGRYEITSLKGTGNFVVYDGEMPVVNEILTDNASNQIGITKLEVDLSEGNTIQISGINKVLFKPAEIKLKTTLPSGNHLVGRDVPAGSYVVTTAKGSGNFVVYNGEIPVVNEILGGDLGVEKVKVSLKEGQMIVISGLESVKLTQ